MSPKFEDDDLESEYDFSGAERGKYHQRFRQSMTVILLHRDVAQTFKDSASVNRALRLLIDLARQVVPQCRSTALAPQLLSLDGNLMNLREPE